MPGMPVPQLAGQRPPPPSLPGPIPLPWARNQGRPGEAAQGSSRQHYLASSDDAADPRPSQEPASRLGSGRHMAKKGVAVAWAWHPMALLGQGLMALGWAEIKVPGQGQAWGLFQGWLGRTIRATDALRIAGHGMPHRKTGGLQKQAPGRMGRDISDPALGQKRPGGL